MPIDDGSGVLVGEICEGCIHLRPMQGVAPCPYGNSQWPDKKTFFVGEDGTPGSKCHKYVTYDDLGVEAMSNSMKKEASMMTESQLNVALYRKVMALSEKDQQKMFKYWKYLYPDKYAEEMVTDDVETKPKFNHRKVRRDHDAKEPKFDDKFKAKGE